VRTNSLYILLILAILVWVSSCRKDFEYAPSAGNLSFSKDTVFLDTVFGSIGSSTYTLKVYNNTKDDVLIPSIQLKNGEESFYRLNVDGVDGKTFQNIPLYAEDSLFIFIETTISFTEQESSTLLYNDVIVFDTDTNKQQVELVTLAKDAIFLFPNDDGSDENKIILGVDDGGNNIEVNAFNLTNAQLNFSNIKPYVIYGYATVNEGEILTIDSGARVHFHNNSGLLIKNGGQLIINGTLSENKNILEGEVVFEGDRLEPFYENIPGQWDGIWFSNGSINNNIDHLTIKNANLGMYIEGYESLTSPTLTIKNSQIYNSTKHNIKANNTNILAENLVLGGAGKSSLYCANGGAYSFIHSTIANYWNNGFRIEPSLEISNFLKFDENSSGNALLKADFKNCIIDGNRLQELSLTDNGENEFNFTFQNCNIKFSGTVGQDSPYYAFESDFRYSNILLNGFMDYFQPTKNDLKIGLESEVINLGALEFAQETPEDLLGNDRTMAPDLGAFQAIIKEK
jgi:hypothetical protein